MTTMTTTTTTAMSRPSKRRPEPLGDESTAVDPDYWLERWQKGRIGFHRADANPRLVEHHRALGDAIRVLVPLCGKSADLEWLVVHGFEVVGIELSELAAQAFFSERGFTPERNEQGPFVAYQHGNVTIFVGDFFAASSAELGAFDGAYDRAAMIALPPELRARYAAHLQTLLAPKAKLLLLTLHFDAPGGPPFSVAPEEVANAYAAAASIKLLASVDAREDAPGPVERGASFVHENAYAIAFG
jgi:thiopurine S-methyltransferase